MQEFFTKIGISNPAGGGPLAVIIIFLVAFLVAWLFMPKVRRYAIRTGTADQPNERRLNKEPLPNIGGLAIYAGLIAALILAVALRPIQIQGIQIQLLTILLGGTIVLLLGFIDDQFGLPPLFRLLVQILAAGLLVVNGIRIDFFTNYFAQTSLIDLGKWLGTIITILWIVGITNAINLMDGMDGLVGGLGFIASCVLLAISAQFPERAAATFILAALAGACLGFLRHNFNPSHIILGDAGAYFIGYVLAAVSILGSLKGAAIASLVSPLLFLAIPIFDTMQVIIKRLLRRVNPLSTPGKDHLHHQLLKAGLGQRRSTVLLWFAILLMNVIGMIVQGIDAIVIIVTVIGIVTLLAIVILPKVRESRKK